MQLPRVSRIRCGTSDSAVSLRYRTQLDYLALFTQITSIRSHSCQKKQIAPATACPLVVSYDTTFAIFIPPLSEINNTYNYHPVSDAASQPEESPLGVMERNPTVFARASDV